MAPCRSSGGSEGWRTPSSTTPGGRGAGREQANGFVFEDYTPDGASGDASAGARGLQEPDGWRASRPAGMAEDHSWDRSAREYVKIYERAVNQGRREWQRTTCRPLRTVISTRPCFRPAAGARGFLGGVVRALQAAGPDDRRARDRLRRQGDDRQAERRRQPQYRLQVPKSQAMLGRILFNGEHGIRQRASGLMWLTLACDGPGAKEAVDYRVARDGREAGQRGRARACAYSAQALGRRPQRVGVKRRRSTPPSSSAKADDPVSVESCFRGRSHQQRRAYWLPAFAGMRARSQAASIARSTQTGT